MTNHYRRLIILALSYRWWILLAAFAGFLTIGSSIGLLMTSAYIIAKAALHPSIADLQLGIVGVRFFGIARGVFRYFERYIGHEVTFRLLAKFRTMFYEALVPIVPAGLAGHRSGDLLERSTRDIEELQYFFTRVLAPPLVAIMVTLLMWVLLGVFHWILPLILTIALIVAGGVLPQMVRHIKKNHTDKLTEIRGQISDLLIDQVQGLGEILVFNQEKNERERIEDLSERLAGLERRQEFFDRLADGAILCVMQFTLIISMMVIIPDIVSGQVEGVYFAVILLGIMAAFEVAAPLATGIDQKEQIGDAAARMFEIYDQGIRERLPRKTEFFPEKTIRIDFKDISFGYDREKMVLQHIDLTLETGQIYVLVGGSGAGKTSLHRLLCRFWEATSGIIKLNQLDLRELPQEYLVSQFSIMEQHPAFFSGTIRENLTLGDDRFDDHSLNLELVKVDLWKLVRGFPQGLSTWVGEGGRNLSGGERQRLGIARMFLHKKPVMIFDEPTAHLDPELAGKILDAIYAYRDSHIVVIITHRLQKLERADQILVMERGNIVERGTHAELISRQAIFYRMRRSQHRKNIKKN